MRLLNSVLPLAVIIGLQYVQAAPASAATQSSTSTSSGSGKTTTTTTSSTGTCPTSGTAQSLSIPQSQPSNAAVVPNNFIGFGFETAFLNDYANAFSQNLVNSVASRLGGTVIIRVGGTSGDRVLFDPKQSQAKICVSGDCPAGSSATYSLGPSYFRGFKAFPNQHFTFQAPLGGHPNITGSLDYVSHAYAALGAARVDAIAIGNEPDGYNGVNGTKYTAENYTQAALLLESKIVKKLGLSPTAKIFEVLDMASAGVSGNFTLPEAFDDGLNKRGNAKYAAQHWYESPTNLPNYGPANLQYYLMNHSAITSMYGRGYQASLEYIQQNQPGVGYILSETGSSLIGPPLQYQDAFGACLWYVDFNLYSMSLGVQRVDGTGRPAAPHSLWVPDRSANSPSLGREQNIGPEVRSPYYATPMLADFLGKSSGAVVPLLGQDTLTAYALYDPSTGDLSKVALVNLNYWSSDTGGTRNNVTFEVPVGSNVNQVTVGRLHADAGAHALGYDHSGASNTITWEGETWSFKLDRGKGSQVAGVPQTETVDVCNGVANVIVPDSEAVIVYVGSSASSEVEASIQL